MTIEIEPPIRLEPAWDLPAIETAEYHAANGHFRLAADICDWLKTDDRVIRCLNVRSGGLLGLDVEFEQSGDKRRSNVAVKALEAQDDWWRITKDEALRRVNDSGVLLGIGLAQLIYEDPDNTGRVVPRIDPWSVRNLRYSQEDGSWTVCTATKEIAITPGDGKWWIYQRYGKHSPISAPWRAVARWKLLKDYAKSDWAVQGERARGVLVAKPPYNQELDIIVSKDDSATKTKRSALATQLSSMARNAAIVLPDGFTLELIQSAANTYQTYKDQIAIADAGIALALCGQNLTSEVSGGSLAAANIHREVEYSLIEGDEEALSASTHYQILVPWAELNFGDRKLAPWVCYETDPPEDGIATANLWTATASAVAAMEAIAAKVGLIPDYAEILRKVGFPTKTETQ